MACSLPKDYYRVLDVSPRADLVEIRVAYRRMVKRYHPDLNRAPRATESFLEIREAYDTLSNPLARREYDARKGMVPWERPRPVANAAFDSKIRIARYRTVSSPFRTYGNEVANLRPQRTEQSRRIVHAVWTGYVAVVAILVATTLVLGLSAASAGLLSSGAMKISAALMIVSFVTTAWAARRMTSPGP